jgi:hypothetical protein
MALLFLKNRKKTSQKKPDIILPYDQGGTHKKTS